MGAAVIGGLMLSTLLSLVFVPAMFVLIDKLENWTRGLFRRWRPAEPTHTAAE
jgi:hypothetical protein